MYEVYFDFCEVYFYFYRLSHNPSDLFCGFTPISSVFFAGMARLLLACTDVSDTEQLAKC